MVIDILNMPVNLDYQVKMWNDPEKGYRAFYLDLKYKDANGGEYTESTRMFVADEDEVFLK